ncbi:MAG: TIGR04084 family radical SAM/SPASM domain-containing protein [Candidatus Bathyarchaeota archaeon]|nr:TIGR04084 family radical SAM/SPASM domain-containing protein [Candidatus Bathyarchaeota archaeon]
MFFHVMLTSECNLQCKYCFGESLEDFDEDFGDDIEVEYALPKEVSYNMETLDRFCKKDNDCTLTFYGGEPLLCIDQLKQIMKSTSPKRFMIQTNGLLLDRLEPKYINKFHTMLVSIDGEETLTNYYRGAGTFRKVINNLKLIKQNGYTGELIARMTIMEQTDIEKQVKWLLNNQEFSFTSVHWQLNAGFWGNDFQRRNFQEWVQTSYNPGIRALAEFWVDQMEQRGVVLKLYPLLGIAYSFLHGEKNCLMRCGAGWINYAIQTDGHIIACPTMWGMEKYYLGHIADTDPNNLKQMFVADKPCVDCKILGICGGRCLYTNLVKRWKDEEYAFVCQTVENLADSVKAQIPRIQSLIENKKISLSQFDYVKYNGAEIIP